MRTSCFRLVPLSAIFICSILVASAPGDEQPDKKDPVRATIEGSAWCPDGSLVMCVRIHAPTKRTLKLFTGTLGISSDKDAVSDYKPFSMAGSYMVDGYTGNKIAALPQLPPRPYYGSMETGAYVTNNGWVELAVAFTVPPTPLGQDGKPLPYKLTLFTTLDTPPVAVVPPPAK